ncbi:MAG: hypothetical protein PHS44_03595 [Candidatus Dojkabacteria bacterium]|nr:hypothetical protein [Candidatus Dojkabacteria bacterium]
METLIGQFSDLHETFAVYPTRATIETLFIDRYPHIGVARTRIARAYTYLPSLLQPDKQGNPRMPEEVPLCLCKRE